MKNKYITPDWFHCKTVCGNAYSDKCTGYTGECEYYSKINKEKRNEKTDFSFVGGIHVKWLCNGKS